MEAGDVVFFKSNSFVGKAISFLTDSPYSHVALAVSETEIMEADRFIKVRVRKLEADEVVMVRKANLTPSQKVQLLSIASKQLNKGYDYKSILKWLLRLLFKWNVNFVDNANTLLCSELIDRCYQSIGIDLVPERATGDVTPYHLLKSKYFT